MKHGLIRYRKAALGAAFALLASLCAAQTVDDNPNAKQQVLDQVSSILSKYAFVPGVDFSKWSEFLKQEQSKIDASKDDDEFQRAVNEALRKFGASHTVLNAPKIADLRLTGTMVGVGITTRVQPDGLLVTRTIDDAPAQRGGIIPGDLIIKVDGSAPDGTKGIDGREGTDVTLTVKHVDKSVDDYILTRRKFNAVHPEELTWPDKKTALLSIDTFGFTYKRDHVESLMKEAADASNLILDLRYNGGGEIGNLRHLLGLLLPFNKPVGTFINRTMVDNYVSHTHASPTDLAAIARWSQVKMYPIPVPGVAPFKGQIVVLINGTSGSASEIIAQGLRDVLGAKVVGTKSAGMVLVSQYVSVTNGFMLQYPLSDYVTINGVRLEGTGVTPDEIVPEVIRAPGVPDAVVDKARTLFTNGA